MLIQFPPEMAENWWRYGGDSAVSAGGHQVIVTHEGYVIPLHVCNGLCYMDMKPASDSDLDQYTLIQFPPEMDENWLRYELLN